MANFLNCSIFLQIVKSNENALREIGADLPIRKRIKPFLAHSFARYIVCGSLTMVAQEIAASTGNFISTEKGRALRHPSLGRNLRRLLAVDLQNRIDVEEFGLEPINLPAKIDDLAGYGSALFS